MTLLLDLPAHLLTTVLHLVPLEERLGVCALVCSRLHAAAVAATSSISKQHITHSSSLQLWLDRHGSQLVSINITKSPHLDLCQLLCPLLEHLHLEGCHLQLTPTEHQQGAISCCTSLKRLVLMVEDTGDSSRGLDCLSVMTALQQLQLQVLPVQRAAPSTGVNLPGHVLRDLIHLTHLQLNDHLLQSHAALRHITALSALRHLDLEFGSRWLTPGALTDLQHLVHLTALVLYGGAMWPLTPKNLPVLRELPALRVLCLTSTQTLDPAVLCGCTGLQQLSVCSVRPLSADSASELLTAVGSMQHLTSLFLHYYRYWHGPSAAAYSALTASTALQTLYLSGCALPEGAWQHMFSAERPLPYLRTIELPRASEAPPVAAAAGAPAGQCLTSSDLQALASCCPSLQDLHLDLQLQPSAQFLPLQALTGFTHLALSPVSPNNLSSISVLTRLKQLQLRVAGASEAVGVLQLTALQQLTRIYIKDVRILHLLGYEGPWLELDLKAPAGCEDDVWQQLRQHLEQQGLC